ncbi:MAG: 5-formyltetrahydrofolate cyclo-ligase [Eubacteriales bacterium]|nr:5-formyltetrahydrofolate cyclo-ligase [Eubacteriales bacterium]
MKDQLCFICPAFWTSDFKDPRVVEKICSEAEASELIQALKRIYKKQSQGRELDLLIAKQQGESLNLRSLDLSQNSVRETLLNCRGLLIADLKERYLQGESFRAEQAGSSLIDLIEMARALNLPCLGLASGFSTLVYAGLLRAYGSKHLSLAADCELKDSDWRIFWPEDPANRASEESGELKSTANSSLRFGGQREKLSSDPDYPQIFTQDSSLYLLHRGERELHPAIQGRLYRAGWVYLATDENEQKASCLALSSDAFHLALISDFDFSQDAEPDLLCEFVHRALKQEAQPDNSSLRKSALAARAALTDTARAAFSAKIIAQLLASEEFKEAKNILIYRAVKAEVNLDALRALEGELGKRFFYPFCSSKTELIALRPESEAAWQSGSFGIPEPIPEQSEEISAGELDLVIAPCVAFAENCERIGMGAGYYDRFLPQCKRAYIMAVAFEAQKLAYLEPKPWDYPLDSVLTEAGRYDRKGG